MSDEPIKYLVRRGRRSRNADLVNITAVERACSAEAPRLAQGSQVSIAAATDDDALAMLAEPAVSSCALSFGGALVVVEVDARGVSLVLPGAIGQMRLSGSVADALQLARALARAL